MFRNCVLEGTPAQKTATTPWYVWVAPVLGYFARAVVHNCSSYPQLDEMSSNRRDCEAEKHTRQRASGSKLLVRVLPGLKSIIQR